jgi:hypothetical protein
MSSFLLQPHVRKYRMSRKITHVPILAGPIPFLFHGLHVLPTLIPMRFIRGTLKAKAQPSLAVPLATNGQLAFASENYQGRLHALSLL